MARTSAMLPRIDLMMPKPLSWVIAECTARQWSRCGPRPDGAQARCLRIERNIGCADINRLLEFQDYAVLRQDDRLPHRFGIHRWCAGNDQIVKCAHAECRERCSIRGSPGGHRDGGTDDNSRNCRD